MDNKKTILIELSSFDKGGLQKVVLDIALIHKNNFNVIIVNTGATGYLSEEARSKGIVVYNIEKNINKYIEILKNNSITLSCSHFSHMGYKLFKKFNIPNITFIHNVYAMMNERQRKAFMKCDKYVDLYISVSKNATRYISDNMGIPFKKIVTIPNGIIIDEHIEKEKNAVVLNRTDFGLKSEDYVFLNVASYNLHKGHYVMVDVMKKIKMIRDDIKILCIGNEVVPSHVAELKSCIKINDLNNHLLMPGFYPNVESFYKMADAVIMPSFIEGWSIAMNEAMFYGKPMILTNTGGAAEVIENNDIGILIDNEYGNILNLNSKLLDDLAYNTRQFDISDKICEAMIEFADNKDKWLQSGIKGKEKIVKHYSFAEIVQRYEQLYLDVIGKRCKKHL